MILLKTTKL